MKRRLIAALAAVLMAGPAFAADPILGLYKTQAGDDGNYGHVQIYECEAAICGVIRKAFNSAGQEIPSDNIGRRMIWDMQAQGNGAYGKGKIWAPDRGKTYSSKMQLSGSALEVSGCVLGICRAQNWTRVQ
ncbi:DUF2147 domain-containing protein [Rhodobacteraceae bacterium]|nr:DUF2147 domain-containing protein [Paracoccaceae bacterium]